MQDPMDNRQAAATWREYLREIRESYRVYTWVWREMISEPAKRWYRKMIIAYVMEIALAMIAPMLIAYVINALIKDDWKTALIGVVGVLLVCSFEKLAAFGVMTCREWVLGLNMKTIDWRASSLFFEKSLGQHLRESNTLSSANVEKGRARILELEKMLLFDGFASLLTSVISILLLFFINPVAGIAMLMVVVIILVWSLYLNQQVAEVMTPLDAEFRALNRYRVERWDHVARVKMAAKEKEEADIINRWFERIIALDRHFWIWYAKNLTARGLLTVLVMVAILGYGVWLVWLGSWEVGWLYPLFSWCVSVQQNIWRLGAIEMDLNWNMPSVRSMMEALTIEPDVTDKASAIKLSSTEPVRLELKNLTHSYETGDDKKLKRVLNNVSFTVEYGEKVALIGRSGAGKTTIMRAILRYMDPTSGSILVNGYDLRDVQLASGLIFWDIFLQETAILDGTIAYNLLYDLPEAQRQTVKDEELWTLMKKLQIDFGHRLLEGLRTKVGSDGVKLSGGEKQRVMIGAAAVRKPRFMIIDEATSSLDALTERQVHDGLRQVLTPDMGALIITHRLATVRDICEKFVVLRSTDELHNGDAQVEAVASSFEELYQLSSTFRQLADEQGLQIDRRDSHSSIIRP